MARLTEQTLIFQIVPWRDLRVSRTVELRANQTLHDLHLAIQSAFDLDDDHAYAFFLNNRAWDRAFEYVSPHITTSPQAGATMLDVLPLRRNKRFLYVFDLGDELRHEVRVAGEGVADASVRYPRIVESVGEAPAQYAEFAEESGEEPAHTESHPLDPSLAELVPAVEAALVRNDDRRFGGRDKAPSSEAELRAEAALATALFDRSAEDLETIHVFEHAVQSHVWGWLCALPLELSLAGLTEEGLRLGERVQAILRRPPIGLTLPLLHALAHRPAEAREHLERNLAEYPDDPLMLLRAAQTFRALGELDRAEEAFRDSIRWVGGDVEGRREAVGGLVRVLSDLGRATDVEAVLRSEQLEQERRRRERAWDWQAPLRRESPKLSRNALCPCGSGKKAKRCCGA